MRDIVILLVLLLVVISDRWTGISGERYNGYLNTLPDTPEFIISF